MALHYFLFFVVQSNVWEFTNAPRSVTHSRKLIRLLSVCLHFSSKYLVTIQFTSRPSSPLHPSCQFLILIMNICLVPVFFRTSSLLMVKSVSFCKATWMLLRVSSSNVWKSEDIHYQTGEPVWNSFSPVYLLGCWLP